MSRPWREKGPSRTSPLEVSRRAAPPSRDTIDVIEHGGRRGACPKPYGARRSWAVAAGGRRGRAARLKARVAEKPRREDGSGEWHRCPWG